MSVIFDVANRANDSVTLGLAAGAKMKESHQSNYLALNILFITNGFAPSL